LKHLKCLGYTWKVVRIIPEARNTPETIMKRKEYVEKFIETSPSKMTTKPLQAHFFADLRKPI
jgi:hypothetical protein